MESSSWTAKKQRPSHNPYFPHDARARTSPLIHNLLTYLTGRRPRVLYIPGLNVAAAWWGAWTVERRSAESDAAWFPHGFAPLFKGMDFPHPTRSEIGIRSPECSLRASISPSLPRQATRLPLRPGRLKARGSSAVDDMASGRFTSGSSLRDRSKLSRTPRTGVDERHVAVRTSPRRTEGRRGDAWWGNQGFGARCWS